MSTWLFAVCGMLLVMIVLGRRYAADRVRSVDHGVGALSGRAAAVVRAEWERLFALYQRIPQYHLVNDGFGLDGFKHIFWLEWTHRLWGRLIGVVFLVPLVVLGCVARSGRVFGSGWSDCWCSAACRARSAGSWSRPASRRIARPCRPTGWSPTSRWPWCCSWRYSGRRLACCVRVPRGVQRSLGFRVLTVLCAGLVPLTVVAGGFVAGLHAGLVYNEFPLMGGGVVPPDYASLQPFAPQSDGECGRRAVRPPGARDAHRAGRAGDRGGRAACGPAAGGAAGGAGAGGLVVAQYALGVATLLGVVPVPLATAHQAVAVMLLAALTVTHPPRPAACLSVQATVRDAARSLRP